MSINTSNKRLAKTIIISGLGVLISYAINFLLTPYITNNVGLEAYGFVSIAKTAVSYAQVITVALTTFVIRYISVSYHENKIKESNEYYSSSLIGCVILSGAIYIVMFFIIWKLEYLLNIPGDLVPSVKILFLLIFFNFILTTVVIPLTVGNYIKNRLDLEGVVKIVSYLIDAFVLFVLFTHFNATIWFVGVGAISASLVNVFCNYYMKKKLIPEVRLDVSAVSFEKVKEMMSNGIWQSLNSIGNILNSGLDLIVSNLMLTGMQTGQIAVTKTISTMFSVLYQTIFQPFQPQLLKAYTENDKNNFLKEVAKSMKICGYFSNVAFAGFVVLGELYYELWIPEQDTKLLYFLTVITVFSSITEGISHPMYYINTLTLKKKIPCFVTIFGGFLNTLGMYVFLKYTSLGIYSIVMTTAVIMTCINLFFIPLYASKCLKLKPWKLYSVIIPHIFSAFIMISGFKIIAVIIEPSGWVTLIFSAMLMAVVGIFIHGTVMKYGKFI